MTTAVLLFTFTARKKDPDNGGGNVVTTVTYCTINTSTVIIVGRAFCGSAAAEIYIPDSVKVIGYQAFNKLERITLASIDDWCMVKSKTDKIYAKINDSYEYYWAPTATTLRLKRG